MKDSDWFWIAGIVKQECFSLLTTAPGPDVAPYHDRQIVTFQPDFGLHWLTMDIPVNGLLQSTPARIFKVKTLRKNGEQVIVKKEVVAHDLPARMECGWWE